MGEILRAVMEQSCTWSRVRFYSARLHVPAGAAVGASFSAITTFDKFGCFLLTSFYVGSTVGGTRFVPAFGLNSYSHPMQLQDLQTGKNFFKSTAVVGGPVGMNVASYASSPVELEEYPLFGPGERIRWVYTVGPGGVGTDGDFADICYSGIEYLMPGGVPDGRPSA